MNVFNVTKYGNLTFLRSLKDLKSVDEEKQGACGTWSIKDIVSHLTSFEILLKEIIETLLDKNYKSKLLSNYALDHGKFNDSEVKKRKSKILNQVIDEYSRVYEKNTQLMKKIEKKQLAKNATLPWYGNEYSFEDLIVYMYYGHKIEHTTQIKIFLTNLNKRDYGKKAI